MGRGIAGLLLAVTLVSASCKLRDKLQGGLPPPEDSDRKFDIWQGRWTGPEGTFLVLERKGSVYSILIHSLDGTGTYEGKRVDDHIEFLRNGTREALRQGDGQATGMKWLLDKKSCLVIKQGEGFCRD